MLSFVIASCLLSCTEAGQRGGLNQDGPSWIQLIVAQADSLHALVRVGPRRTLVFDLESFNKAAVSAEVPQVTVGELGSAVARPVIDRRSKDAVVCNETRDNCRVIEDGLLIAVDTIIRRGEALEVRVTYTVTQPRPNSVATCSIRAFVVLGRKADRWAVESARGLRRC